MRTDLEITWKTISFFHVEYEKKKKKPTLLSVTVEVESCNSNVMTLQKA